MDARKRVGVARLAGDLSAETQLRLCRGETRVGQWPGAGDPRGFTFISVSTFQFKIVVHFSVVASNTLIVTGNTQLGVIHKKPLSQLAKLST